VPGRGRRDPDAAGRSDGPLVGRNDLLAELVATADAASQGSGAVVVLTGEAGAGKTTVARALAREVRDRLTVSWGSGVADRGAPAFWPWRTLVDLSPSDHSLTDEHTIGAARFERLAALRDRICARALAEPRLHVLEDMQWADVASLLLLAHLTEVVGDLPLLVAATLRTGETASPQVDAAVEDVCRASLVRAVPALDAAGVAALMRAATLACDEQVVQLVTARTGGNALFVTELLRSIPASASLEAQRSLISQNVPDRLGELVARRLERLPPQVVDALVAAAVVGIDGDVSTVAAMLGCDTRLLLDLFDQARAAHILDAAQPGRWRFRHQIIRDAVYATMSTADRAARHAAVVEVLAADPSTSPAALAHHALAAQPLFDADRAVALAADAGEAAFGQHAYEEAVEWFTRALEAAPRDTSARWRAELLVLSAEACRHMGDTVSARDMFVRAAELTNDAALLARAALGYADPGADLGIAYRSDDTTTADLLQRALAAQPVPDSPTAVQLLARLAADLYFSDEPSRARTLAATALERARRLKDTGALVTATAVVHDAFVVGQAHLEEQLAESSRLLEWARADGSVSALLTAHRARVLDTLAAGDLAAMDSEVFAFSRLAEPLRIPGLLWWPALWSTMRALLEGHHDVAEQRAFAAYELGASSFPSLAQLNLSFLFFFLRREQGRLAELEQLTRDLAASRADIPAIRIALVFLLAELDHVDEARAILAELDGVALDRLHDRNWPASWFQLARAAWLVGDRDLAAMLLERHRRPTEICVQVSLATVCLGAVDLGVAWLLHTLGDLDAADTHYRAAELTNARIGARSWLARARADHASLLLERDDKADRDLAHQLHALAEATAADIGLATLRAVPSVDDSDVAAPVFRRSGEVWELAFEGRLVQVPHARGMSDLRFLLARPGVAVSVLELTSDAGPATATRGAAALDDRARREIRDRLRELDDEEAGAEAAGDGERAALAREQRQLLAESFARDLGLGGRSRLIDDPVERARKTVSTRIRRTIRAIAGAHPELGRHLERSIDTGAWCAYRPAEPIDWRT
jgi:tetratricopeptide (TPR) repeat protein